MRKIETPQAGAVDDRHVQVTKDGDVVSNFALANSARDLYEQCCNAAKENNLSDDNVPSLSWFRFQFWPKTPYTHTALNDTGRLRIEYYGSTKKCLQIF